jgi:hypothetical protein
MKIITEVYDDDDILRNRIEEFFCDKCGHTVESKFQLFNCVRYVVVKNPNKDTDIFTEGYQIGEDKFMCCFECKSKLTNDR